jgi:hypothetical protein
MKGCAIEAQVTDRYGRQRATGRPAARRVSNFRPAPGPATLRPYTFAALQVFIALDPEDLAYPSPLFRIDF